MLLLGWQVKLGSAQPYRPRASGGAAPFVVHVYTGQHGNPITTPWYSSSAGWPGCRIEASSGTHTHTHTPTLCPAAPSACLSYLLPLAGVSSYCWPPVYLWSRPVCPGSPCRPPVCWLGRWLAGCCCLLWLLQVGVAPPSAAPAPAADAAASGGDGGGCSVMAALPAVRFQDQWWLPPRVVTLVRTRSARECLLLR